MNEMTAAVLKRNILIVDDEIINREILGNFLSENYLVTYADNGREALDILASSTRQYSLILLDLIMPGMSGFEFLEYRSRDSALKQTPVIVMTSEKGAEVKSIRMGAADFITKPFGMPEVILARCERIIELSEDKSIIRSIEKDAVTGLYTKEFFFEYVRQLMPRIEGETDAVVLNIDRFRLMNELFGRKEGNAILAKVAELIREVILTVKGIACRAEADTFMVFCAHQEGYPAMLARIQHELSKLTHTLRIRLRAGVCPNTDSSLMVETWFDRAKSACDRIRGDYIRQVELYSTGQHERAVFRERLISDIDKAIANRDIRVYYQPKYRIQGDQPRLSSAEALVRWIHPELGFISPGEFIPLFESNGLIQKLDNYVWSEAARQVMQWKETYGVSVPVSVNVSRVDIYDPELEDKLARLLETFHLDPGELMLEITETAYADNADNLIEVVQKLRGRGFMIEMDDFGSGYSSLNMLTTIPIDVLKMDMKFIRNMLRDEKSLRLVELIVDIAQFLGVPVVAEGVEEEAQLRVLKEMGCACIQGYYFSKPVPPAEFVPFIEAEQA